MPTTQSNRNNSSSSTNSGFSLMSSLGGSSSNNHSGSGSNAGASTPASRLREGLSSMVSSPSNNSASSSNSKNVTSPGGPAIPLGRTSHSFSSPSSYHQQLKQQQMQQQYRRRVPTYRSGHNNPSSPTNKQYQSGILPNKSMDSGDQRFTGESSIAGLSMASSFDDCYKQNTAGYNDAFALLSPESNNKNSIKEERGVSGDASSPSRSNRRSYFPSSPHRPKHNQSSPDKSKSPSAKSPHATIDGDPHLQHPLSSINNPARQSKSGTMTSPPNTPPASGSPSMHASSSNSIATAASTSMRNSASKVSSPPNKELPPPPSASKTNPLRSSSPQLRLEKTKDVNDAHATTAASTTSTRHASPMASLRMKHTLQKTWNKAKHAAHKGGNGSGHVRQRSKGSGSYSDAVNKALQMENEDNADNREDGLILMEAGSKKSSGGMETASQGGIEVISPSISNNDNNSSGGKLGKGANNRLRMRHRSPSPIRHLEGNSPITDDTIDDPETISNDHSNNHPDEEESNATTPSFFSGRGRSIRAMSPARMKKNLKKRLLAIPASPRRDGAPQSVAETTSPAQSLHQPRQRESPRLPLHPSTEITSNHSEEDDGLADMANLSLVNTSMSFDVDDYETEEGNDASVESFAGKDPAQAPLSSDANANDNTSGKKVGDDRDASAHPDNIFESPKFVRAMGGDDEAALATNYIRTGDALCAKDKEFDRAIPAYYAGLSAILSRVRRWASKEGGTEISLDDVDTDRSSFGNTNMLHKDFVKAAQSTEMNVLLLAMSTILLRSGNAHFHLKHWETASRDFVSAQSYRSLRQKALLSQDVGRRGSNDGDRFKVELGSWDLSSMLEGRISNNMASAKSKLQLYEEARAEYTEALRIKQCALQTLHENLQPEGEAEAASSSKEVDDGVLVCDIATTLHNIGLLRSKCGELKKAEKAFTQSLSLRVKKFGLDDLGVSTTLRALGDLYFNEKRYDDAFRSYKESLRIWKLHSGKSDLIAAELYYNIGLVFYSKGPYSKAKISMVECLRIRREHCGSESLVTASALYLLGLISSAMGDYGDAKSQLEECLGIRQKYFERESPMNLLLMNVHLALGDVHQLNGDYDLAMDSYSVSLSNRVQRLGKHHPSVSEVLQSIGVAYIAVEEFSKALETLEETLRIRRGLLGPSMEVAETLDSLGLIHFKSGDTKKAVELSEEALSVLKNAVGFDHVLVSKVLKNIGDYYQDAEELDDAIESYNESLRVMTLWYGREHKLLSEVLNEIGVTRFKKGEFMIARQLFTQALRIMRTSKNGVDKSSIFPTLTHLGHALYKNKDIQIATETYLESFKIQVSIITGEDNLGPQDFSERLNAIKERVNSTVDDEEQSAFLSDSLGGIASILRYLGLVYQEQGDFETALSVNKLSLAVRLCQPYKEYSAIALMAETIAMFEFKRTNLNSALDYFNQALDAKKSYQGDSTIDVARTVNNLANIHFSLGNLDDAMKLYQDALEIKRLRLGNDSDEVANTLNNIAHVMVTAGKEQEALQAYHNVVRIRQERYGKNHPSVAATLASMGDVYIKLGKIEIAMTYFEQCIRIQKLHQKHCDERVLENLASIYGKLGQWQKAESAFKEVVQMKRSVNGDDSLDIAKTLDLLAVSYIEQDRYADSIEHLQEALRIRKVCLGGEDDEILASLNKLAFVYKSCEMLTEMMEVKAEFDNIQTARKK